MDEQAVGLFGYTSAATLDDVVLESLDLDASFTGNSDYLYAGGLAGKADNTAINDGAVGGDVDAYSYGGVYAGGLVGYSSNTSDTDMTLSSASCSVYGRADADYTYGGYGGYGGYAYGYVGGLVGRADRLNVDSCSATGSVSAYSLSAYGGDLLHAGGLIGYVSLAVGSGSVTVAITDSFATGSVSAAAEYYQYGYDPIAVHAGGSSYASACPFAYAGGLIGANSVDCHTSGTASTTVDQCYATGSVDAFGGGSAGTYSPTAHAGGLIAANVVGSSTATTTVQRSYAAGTVHADAHADGYGGGTPNAYAGGVMGYQYVAGAASTIAQCYATGTVDADAEGYAGAYWASGAYAGGLLGYGYIWGAGGSATGAVSNSYATGDPSASSAHFPAAGGIIGALYGDNATPQVTNCYALGVPTASSGYAGGLVGYSSNVSYTSCYWDTTTSGSSVGTFLGAGSTNSLSGNYYAGQAVNNGGGGTNTSGAGSTAAAALRNASGTGAHAVYSTWNLTQTWKEHPDEEQFPYFRYESEIGTAAQLNAVRDALFAVYRLNDGLDLSGYTNWDPIGDWASKFHGALLGCEYTLDNLSISRDSEEDVGLFGFLGLGNVRDLTLTDVQVRGGSHVGALAGNNEGTVRRCTVRPSSADPADYQVGATYCVLGGGVDSFVLSGMTYYTGANIGGLVGSHDGLLVDCTAQVLVSYNIITRTGTYDPNTHVSDVGGLAGDNNDGAVIRTSVADGDVVAQLEAITDLGPDQELGGGDDEEHNCKIGGLTGENDGLIQGTADRYCEATGMVQGVRQVGGLVCENDGTIRTSYARMDLTRNSNQVSADDQIACFAGQNSGLIEDSFANGEVDGKSGTCNDVGGFVGLNSGTIRRSFFRGDIVDGDNDVGGFCGENASGGLIEYCYTVPTPSGNSNYSPFVRNNGGTVQYDYYTTGGDDGIAGTTEVAAATLLEVLNDAYTYTALFGNWTFDSTHWEVTSNGNDPELAWQD